MCDLIEIMILQFRLSSHLIELGCPGSDMPLGRSNMKLRILGVFNIPQYKVELVYGRFSNK